MKKRYLISFGILALVVGLVLAVLTMLPARPGVTKSNFSRIEKGMKFSDVNAIFGSIHGLDELPLPPPMPGNQKVHLAMAWCADDGAQALIVFEDGVVVDSTWRESATSIFGRVRRWIGLDDGTTAVPPMPAPPPVAIQPPTPVVQEEE